ncbi:MAG: fibronectin type III domain-containing protein [Chthonomonas sp.]|nr:fibronectin type III domain-containing protein [Chthonomonas sp.]
MLVATVSQAAIQIQVELQDFPSPSGQAVTVTFVNGMVGEVSANAALNATGFSNVTPRASVVPGTYTVRVKGKHWLSEAIEGVPVGTFGTSGPFEFSLRNGDIDGDDTVSVFDYFILSEYFDIDSTAPNWTTVGADGFAPVDADIDGDEAVTAFDYFILSYNFDSGAGAPRRLSTTGRKFWLAFPQSKSLPNKQLKLYVRVAPNADDVPPYPQGTIKAGTNAPQSFSLTPGWAVVDVPQTASQLTEVTQDNGVCPNSVYVSTTVAVTIQAVTQSVHNSEAYTAIPVQSLGFDHIVMAWGDSYSQTSFVTVVAPYGGGAVEPTTLTITPSCDAGASGERLQGVPFTVQLQSGQTYQLRSTSPTGDLTGTLISSNHPVAVYSGNRSAQVPNNAGLSNHLLEELPPTDLWGSEFITDHFQLKNPDKPYFVRVLAARNNTRVIVSGRVRFFNGDGDPQLSDPIGTRTVVLRRGEFQQFRLVGPGYIKSDSPSDPTASKPVLVAEYSTGFAFDANGAAEPAPFLGLVPSVSHFNTKLSLFAPHDLPSDAGYSWRQFINLVVPTSQVSALRHNGQTVTNSFEAVPGTAYSVGRAEFFNSGDLDYPNGGRHTFENTTVLGALPIGGFGYGYQYCDGMGYFASMTLAFNGGSHAAPGAPSNVVATTVQPYPLENDFSVHVAWTDGSSNEEGFYIERKRSDSAVWEFAGSVAPNTTQFNDSGASRDANYQYRVCAFGDLSSAWAYSIGSVETPPNAPSGLSAVAPAYNQVVLSWQDASLVETSFIIERSLQSSDPSNPTSWTAGWPVSAHSGVGEATWTDTSTAKQTAYRYRIKAMRNGLHTKSLDFALVTTPDEPPLSPTGLQAVAVSDTQINLSWTNGLRATSTEWQRSLKPTAQAQESDWLFVGEVPVPQTTLSDSGLDGLTHYYYRARSRNDGGTSGWMFVDCTTLMPPPPAAPSGLTAMASSTTSVDLSWTDNAHNETSYVVQRKIASGSWTTITSSLPRNTEQFTDSTVSAYTTYTYRVLAHNAAADTASNEATATTGITFTGGGDFDITVAATGAGQVTVYWQEIANAVGYRLYRSTVSSGPYFQVNQGLINNPDPGPGVVNGQRFTDTGLTEDQDYYYRAVGVSSSGSVVGTSSEDSDVPLATAINWASDNPATIIDQALWNAGEGQLAISETRVVSIQGPNGVQYHQDRFGVETSSGATTAFIGEDSHCVTNGTETYAVTFDPAPNAQSTQIYGYPNEHTGPFRKVSAFQSWRNLSAVVGMPSTTSIDSTRPSRDAAYVYTGGEAGAYGAFDVGFVKKNSSEVWWKAFSASKGRGVNDKGYLWQDGDFKIKGSVRLFFTFPELTSKQAYLAVVPNEPGSVAQLSGTTIDKGVIGSFAKFGKKREAISLKRINSIAQQFRTAKHPNAPLANGPNNSTYKSGAVQAGGTWSEVKVSGADFDSDATRQQGRCLNDPAYVSWLSDNDFFNERSIYITTGQ